MATNEYTNVAELIKDYFDAPVGTYLNKSISINSVTLTCDVYRVANNTILTSSVFTGCTGNDANTQIIIGNNMSVASGTTLTPPYRCKGIFIGDVGTFTNSGTISMTARGASGAGKNIKLVKNYQISATGGAGGTKSFYVQYDATGTDGTSGSAPSSGVLSCGGGGSGAISGAGGNTYTAGSGGTGTSFSGGAGGGGIAGSSNNKTGNNGSSTGGAGGDGVVAGGGAGNPKGANNASNLNSDGTGTGGLIVVIASNIISTGAFVSQGSRASGYSDSYTPTRSSNATGGSSGGGCIVLISRERNITGTNSVAGGAVPSGNTSTSWIDLGGAGGAGAYASYIVDDLILANLPVEVAITDKTHEPNLDASESVRLLGIMDEDELYYDILGTRHRASQGHYIENNSGVAVTRRDKLKVAAPLTVADDSTNQKTALGVDTSGSLDFTQIQAPGNVHNATDGSPVGTVISFLGDSAPIGYLVCDGTAYNRADYPALSAHLLSLTNASLYTVSGDDTKFKVPDLRGEFLRGSGTNSHSNQGSGSTVGSHQDATEIAPINTSGNNKISIRKDSSLDWGIQNQDSNTNVVTGNIISATATSSSLSNAFAYNTTRPTNTSVLMCIKYI